MFGFGRRRKEKKDEKKGTKETNNQAVPSRPLSQHPRLQMDRDAEQEGSLTLSKLGARFDLVTPESDLGVDGDEADYYDSLPRQLPVAANAGIKDTAKQVQESTASEGTREQTASAAPTCAAKVWSPPSAAAVAATVTALGMAMRAAEGAVAASDHAAKQVAVAGAVCVTFVAIYQAKKAVIAANAARSKAAKQPALATLVFASTVMLAAEVATKAAQWGGEWAAAAARASAVCSAIAAANNAKKLADESGE
jgi:hypothetical protein